MQTTKRTVYLPTERSVVLVLDAVFQTQMSSTSSSLKFVLAMSSTSYKLTFDVVLPEFFVIYAYLKNHNAVPHGHAIEEKFS